MLIGKDFPGVAMLLSQPNPDRVAYPDLNALEWQIEIEGHLKAICVVVGNCTLVIELTSSQSKP